MGIPEGIFDNFDTPEKLDALVVSISADPAIHGYSVFSDLAVHYTFTEMIYLALTGEIPDQKIGKAFEYVLKFLFPMTAAEAPSNAGILAKVCSGESSAVLSVTAVTLVDMASFWMEKHEKLLSWLEAPHNPFPKEYCNQDRESQSIVRQFSKLIYQTGISSPIFEHNPTLIAALIAILYACDIKKSDQIKAAIVFAKYPCAITEGFATASFSFKKYPIRLPDYKYEGAAPL